MRSITSSARPSFLHAFFLLSILLFVGLTFPSGSFAQSNDVVTNATIIKLSKAGVGKQVIMSKIENSPCNFDLSSDGLIDLKNSGVPDDIVATMLNKNSAANQQQPNMGPDTNAQAGNSANDQADISVTATAAPPELPTYEQPECPTEGYLWVPGYWAFNLVNGFFWVPGVWVAPPNPGLLWTPAYWGYNGNIYAFHRGYWGERVGFYGGINYGYGYNGVGFVGGEWHGRVYRYNTAVVRVNTVIVHNTYVDRTVVRNTAVVNRTSFNGRGGIDARPRPEEISAMRERHVQPTSEQVSHQRLASTDKNQFARENNGHPAQVALPKVDQNAIRNQRANNPNFNRNNKSDNNNPNRPANNGNNPAGNPNRPTDNNVTRPADNSNKPADNSTRFNNNRNKPADNATQPANNPNRPADKPNQSPEPNRPATNTVTPAATNNQPTINKVNPSNNSNRQGGGRNRTVNPQKTPAQRPQQQHNNPKPEKKNDKKQ